MLALVGELVFEAASLPDAVLEAVSEPAVFEADVATTAAPAVIVTGMMPRSVPVYVVVLMPGKFASAPPYDSVHTAELPSSEHCWYPVLCSGRCR